MIPEPIRSEYFAIRTWPTSTNPRWCLSASLFHLYIPCFMSSIRVQAVGFIARQLYSRWLSASAEKHYMISGLNERHFTAEPRDDTTASKSQTFVLRGWSGKSALLRGNRRSLGCCATNLDRPVDPPIRRATMLRNTSHVSPAQPMYPTSVERLVDQARDSLAQRGFSLALIKCIFLVSRRAHNRGYEERLQ